MKAGIAAITLAASAGLGGCVATVAGPAPVVVAPASVVVGPARQVCGWVTAVGPYGGVRKVWRCRWVR